MDRRLYFLTMNLNTSGQSDIDLPLLISNVRHHLLFKHHNGVTGESKLIAVFDVSSDREFNEMVSGLVKLGNIDISCKPVIPYEKFGSVLNVDENLTSANDIRDAELFWLDFSVEFPGKSTDELLDTWKRVAAFALQTRNTDNWALYKVVAEMKVHLFIAMEPEDLDKLSFELPLMKENGSGVTISTHALCKF